MSKTKLDGTRLYQFWTSQWL